LLSVSVALDVITRLSNLLTADSSYKGSMAVVGGQRVDRELQPIVALIVYQRPICDVLQIRVGQPVPGYCVNVGDSRAWRNLQAYLVGKLRVKVYIK
jgi:hypothetical protein